MKKNGFGRFGIRWVFSGHFLFSALLILMVSFVGAAPAMAAMDFADYDGLLTDENLVDTVTSDFLDTDDSVVGSLVSSVYELDDTYLYVLDVTPGLIDSTEFNMGIYVGASDFSSGYGDYGYDFEQAQSAIIQYGTGSTLDSSNDIFEANIDPDNTIDWSVNFGYLFDDYYWQANSSITFFFEHTSAPVDGFYNLTSGTVSSTAAGLTPSAVPLPSSILLLGGSLIMGAAARRLKMKCFPHYNV